MGSQPVTDGIRCGVVPGAPGSQPLRDQSGDLRLGRTEAA